MPGRTGRRRYTEAEARLVGPKAAYEHRRLYGAAPGLPPLPDPPEWFAPALVEIWQSMLAAAAPGSLAALDYDNLVAYCVAAQTHRRLAQQVTSSRRPTVVLERRLRLAGAELGRASKVLGIQPADRSKIPVPPSPPPEVPVNPHLRSVTLVEAGRVRGIYKLRRK
jgi:hypothetical protein